MSLLETILKEIADPDIRRLIENHSTTGRVCDLSGPAFIALLSMYKSSELEPNHAIDPMSIEWLLTGIHSTLDAACWGKNTWWQTLCASGVIEPRIADCLYQFDAAVQFVITGRHDQSPPVDPLLVRAARYTLRTPSGKRFVDDVDDEYTHRLTLIRGDVPLFEAYIHVCMRGVSPDRANYLVARAVRLSRLNRPPSQIMRLPPIII